MDIDAFYRRYSPMVFRRCRQLLRDDDESTDAMQDVFLQLVRYQQRLDARGPSSLLNRIATNVCLNRIRSRRAAAPDERVVELVDLLDLEERTLARRVLGRIFADEADSTHHMAVLHYVDGMTLDEVAVEVGLSVSGVRKRLRTLKERLAAPKENAA
jgi:RNA polymerase sigma factor (sigma-70 family)